MNDSATTTTVSTGTAGASPWKAGFFTTPRAGARRHAVGAVSGLLAALFLLLSGLLVREGFLFWWNVCGSAAIALSVVAEHVLWRRRRRVESRNSAPED
ncbi:hypothetical protein [Actinopolyspora mortivallis]|uniref:DUF2530 domain-containing protein n=1 Tax=Actinopolyspora mortivallis TaxID=33906 RepID=A0A2T0GW16_ACTMO|nr:hypothetical protein [Actinopolyspora mortivallis]PRW63299.1 hypothetical protein CEP50_10795 [Actinopolyspora mortivallis]